jgi:beta-glucanase (GH16 family)
MRILPLIISIFFIPFLQCQNEQNVNLNTNQVHEYKLIWSDEFDYTGLPSETKWNYDVGGHGWGNNELQYYTYKNLKNARVENGILIIESHKENIENKNYSSARLITKGKGDWKYGKIEVRAKLPAGIGSWPAIWMLGSTTPLKWPDDGEIDIMEHVGFDPSVIHASVHTKKYHHSIGTQKTNKVIVDDFNTSFHVYEVEWNKEFVSVGIDGKPYFKFDNEGSGYEAWPFDNPMHLLLNIAIGGNWGGQKGIDDTIFPIKMEIDYVRVYQNV